MNNSKLTVRNLNRLLDAGAFTSVELATFCRALAVAGENVWNLNAFEYLSGIDELTDHAKASDSRRKHGEAHSIFDGIPVSIKANIAVSTIPLTAGSKILGRGQPNIPPPGYDADVVRRLLRNSGSVLVGVTTMDEFGMGSLGNTASSPTKNPLPLLHHLSKVMPVDSLQTDQELVDLVKMPSDAILEAHQKAYDSVDDNSKNAIFSAGGSSCGSAASVAHGSSIVSLGTDTGGSVRLPASWCGIVGFKPSYGILSRHGVVSYASSFDTVGVLAKSVDCSLEAFEVLAQRDGDLIQDSTRSVLPKDYVVDEGKIINDNKLPLSGLRIGMPAAFSVEETPASIRDSWSKTAHQLQDAGAQITEIATDTISPMIIQNAMSAYYVLVSAEASSNLSRYDGFRYGVASKSVDEEEDEENGLSPLEQQYSATRTEGFGPEVIKRILCGAWVLSSDHFHTHYEAAAKVRAVLAQQMTKAVEEEVDAMLIPTALSMPCRLDTIESSGMEMYANDVMTIPASLAGLPVLSVPVEIEDEPVFQAGMSLVGARFKESTILRIGKALEAARTASS